MTEQGEHPAQKIKEALAAGRARHEIASLPEEKLLDAILEAPDPRALVRAFPLEDFYFLIHKIGPDDSLPVLAAASEAQWEYLLDLEAWRRDRFDPDSVERWLKRLHEADSPRLVRWLLEEKKDLLDLFLFRTVELRIREHDQDPSDFGEGFFSLDDVYYFRPRTPPGTPESRGRGGGLVSGPPPSSCRSVSKPVGPSVPGSRRQAHLPSLPCCTGPWDGGCAPARKSPHGTYRDAWHTFSSRLPGKPEIFQVFILTAERYFQWHPTIIAHVKRLRMRFKIR